MKIKVSLLVSFEKKDGEKIYRGPYPTIRLERERICDGDSGEVIASHLPQGWLVDGEAFLRLDIREHVTVRWHDAPPEELPATTGHFSSVDGIAYIDRRILGFMDRERNDWYLVRQGHHRPVLLLEPA